MLRFFALLVFVGYVFPLGDYVQSYSPQTESPIFTSQVIKYPNSQYQKTHNDIFQALLVEQTPEGKLRSIALPNDEFQAQGTKKETKVSTPKWRLGAGAFLNKEIDEGSTEKETTFIPTIIELKSSGPESGPESDSDSDDWDSDCDSSSESESKRKNKKSKKTFKLFSLDEVTSTDDDGQKMVVNGTWVNSTVVNYSSIGNYSDDIVVILDSKAFSVHFHALSYIVSCCVYLFLI